MRVIGPATSAAKKPSSCQSAAGFCHGSRGESHVGPVRESVPLACDCPNRHAIRAEPRSCAIDVFKCCSDTLWMAGKLRASPLDNPRPASLLFARDRFPSPDSRSFGITAERARSGSDPASRSETPRILTPPSEVESTSTDQGGDDDRCRSRGVWFCGRSPAQHPISAPASPEKSIHSRKKDSRRSVRYYI